jgi:hypothetical protein
VDPIYPISPGPPPIQPPAGLPVEPLQRISRERDRPDKDAQQRRREPPQPPPREDPDDDEHPHVDVRA